jgi:hypothetical protein
MYKVILAAVLLVALFAVPAFAVPAFAADAIPAQTNALAPLLSNSLGVNIDLNGDIAYLPLRRTGASGPTISLAAFKGGLVVAKAGGMIDFTGHGIGTLMGAVSIPKLVNLLGGTWIASTITVDIEAGIALCPNGPGAIQPLVGAAIVKIPLTQ